jgi:hypothetical protein
MTADKLKVGVVKVVGPAYKFDGPFHRPEKNQPIRDENGVLCGVTNPRDITHVHSYGGEAPFFEGIAKGRLIATKCVNKKCESNGSIFMPFRIACPECLEKMEQIDITARARESAKIYSFMVCERSGAFNTLEKPIKFVNVEFDGVCTILMSYLLKGDPEIGKRVVPIFRTKSPNYVIMDLAFVPAGTNAKDLPEGFTFGA